MKSTAWVQTLRKLKANGKARSDQFRVTAKRKTLTQICNPCPPAERIAISPAVRSETYTDWRSRCYWWHQDEAQSFYLWQGRKASGQKTASQTGRQVYSVILLDQYWTDIFLALHKLSNLSKVWVKLEAWSVGPVCRSLSLPPFLLLPLFDCNRALLLLLFALNCTSQPPIYINHFCSPFSRAACFIDCALRCRVFSIGSGRAIRREAIPSRSQLAKVPACLQKSSHARRVFSLCVSR